MKKRNVIILLILLVVGFAGLATVLVINGQANISFDDGNGDESFTKTIVFSKALTSDGTAEITNNEQNINFETKKLSIVNDTAVLDYEVTNKNRQYDANITVNCGLKSDFNSFSEYLSITNDITSPFYLIAGSSKMGKLTIELKNAYTEGEVAVELACTFSASPVSRETLGDEYVGEKKEPFSEAGTLKATSRTNASDFWKYKSDITKVVFEDRMKSHPTSEDLIFDVSEGTDGTVMSYLVPNQDDVNKYTLYLQSETGIKANLNSSALFYGFNNLTEINGLEYFDTSLATEMQFMFDGCSALTELDLSNFSTNSATNMGSMFNNCSSLVTLDLSNFNTSNVTRMSSMFYNCSSLTTLVLTSFSTNNVTSMMSMFKKCSKISSLNLNNFVTSNVSDMSSMFEECISLTELDLSNFDARKVENMNYMFDGCRVLKTLNLSGVQTSSVLYSMASMFQNCRILSNLDLSGFVVSSVDDMNRMFSYCWNLTTLDISGFTKLENPAYMFESMPEDTKVTVKNQSMKNTILSLSTVDRPYKWNTNNIIIKS